MLTILLRRTPSFGRDTTNRHVKGISTKKSIKFINLHVYSELTKSKKYGNQPTISNLCNTICGAILKTITFFPNGKLTYALNRQSIARELLMSGFSPWVQSMLLLYEAIDKFKSPTLKCQ